MASLTVRNIGDDTKGRLRVAAARAGHSMEEHVRLLIEAEVSAETLPVPGFGSWMHRLFDGAEATGLVLPPREEMAEPITLPR